MKRTVSYDILNKIELNRSFMPFVQNGGIFILTKEDFKLNEPITAHIKFPDENEMLTADAMVIWITPPHSIDYPKTGIGIQFTGEQASSIKERIMLTLDSNYAVGGYIFGNE